MSSILEDAVIRKLISLGANHDSIRAVILFSSRTNPNATLDIFSDYDVAIFAADPEALGQSDDWFEAFGPVLVTFREEPDHKGFRSYTRLVLYEDGTKIDIGVCEVAELEDICARDVLSVHYDHGYEVLIDKDGITASLKKPTHKAYIPTPPTEGQYAYAVNEFWWDSTYVAKYLWRDDLIAAKYMLETWLTQLHLRRMLEWSIEIDRNWKWKPGHYGREIKKALDCETYTELIATCAGGAIGDLWESLFRMAALFRKTAIKVADGLGYEYSHSLDERVTVYHQTVRTLDTRTTDPSILAGLLRERYDQYRP